LYYIVDKLIYIHTLQAGAYSGGLATKEKEKENKNEQKKRKRITAPPSHICSEGGGSGVLATVHCCYSPSLLFIFPTISHHHHLLYLPFVIIAHSHPPCKQGLTAVAQDGVLGLGMGCHYSICRI
jgi:hypothetical protein